MCSTQRTPSEDKGVGVRIYLCTYVAGRAMQSIGYLSLLRSAEEPIVDVARPCYTTLGPHLVRSTKAKRHSLAASPLVHRALLSVH